MHFNNNTILDSLIPLLNETPTPVILGVLGTLKLVLPYTQSKVIDDKMQGSFGRKIEVNDIPLEIDRLLQVTSFKN